MTKEQEKRNGQQELLDKYNESLKHQEEVIVQLKRQQKDLYRKIDELKNNQKERLTALDEINFDSFDFDAKNFMSNIDQKIVELIGNDIPQEKEIFAGFQVHPTGFQNPEFSEVNKQSQQSLFNPHPSQNHTRRQDLENYVDSFKREDYPTDKRASQKTSNRGSGIRQEEDVKAQDSIH